MWGSGIVNALSQNNALLVLSIIGSFITLFVVIQFIYTLVIYFKGILTVSLRIGSRLAKRKIAIFSVNEFNSLESLLVDSKLYKKKNIMRINTSDIGRAEKADLFLVHWKDFKDHIDAILNKKKDQIGLIIYAPQDEGFIDKDTISTLNKHRNVIIVNFRGRLLNDIFTTLIVT